MMMNLSYALLPARAKLLRDALHQGLVGGMNLECLLELDLLHHLLLMMSAGCPNIMPARWGSVPHVPTCL